MYICHLVAKFSSELIKHLKLKSLLQIRSTVGFVKNVISPTRGSK